VEVLLECGFGGRFCERISSHMSLNGARRRSQLRKSPVLVEGEFLIDDFEPAAKYKVIYEL